MVTSIEFFNKSPAIANIVPLWPFSVPKLTCEHIPTYLVRTKQAPILEVFTPLTRTL